MKNSLRFNFDPVTCLNYTFLNFFLVKEISSQKVFQAKIQAEICSIELTPSNERTAAALTDMGPAILNGGITTFMALFLLAFSNYYGFIVFFRVRHYRWSETRFC